MLLHPNWINAWIEAAQYEVEWNKNPTNARLLYQRALSINKHSPSLYLHFFKMEVGVVTQHLTWNLKEDAKSGKKHKFQKQKKFPVVPTEKDFDWKKELEAFNKKTSKTTPEGKVNKQAKDEWLSVVYAQMEVPKMIFRFAMENLTGKVKYAVIKQFLLLIPTADRIKADHGIIGDDLDDDELDAQYRDIAGRFCLLSEYMFEYLERHYHSDAVIIQLLARRNLQVYSQNGTVIKRSVEMAGCQVFQRAVLLLSTVEDDDDNKEDNKKQKKTKKRKKDIDEMTPEKRKEYIVDILRSFIQYLRSRMDRYVKLKAEIIRKRDEPKDEEDGGLNKNDKYVLKLYVEIMNYLVLRMLETFKELVKLSATTEEMFRDWILTLTQSLVYS